MSYTYGLIHNRRATATANTINTLTNTALALFVGTLYIAIIYLFVISL